MASQIHPGWIPLIICLIFCLGAATILQVYQGGTGASTASGARVNLSAAVLGDNNDILSLDKVQQITMNAFATPSAPTGALAAGGSLTNGTTYYFEVVALNSNYTITSGTCVNGCSTPSAASAGFTATSVNKTVNLSWTATTGAPAYLIWANTAATGFTHYILVTGATTLSVTNYPTGFTTGTQVQVNTTGEIINAKAPSLTIQQSTPSTGIIDFETLASTSANCCSTINGNPFITYANPGTGTELITMQDSPSSVGQGYLFWTHSTSGLFQFLTGSGAFAEFDSAGNLDFAGNTILLNTLTGSIGATNGLVQINDTAGTFTSGDTAVIGSDGGITDTNLPAANLTSKSSTAPSANQIACWKTVTPPVLGHCTTALAGTPPTCTCS